MNICFTALLNPNTVVTPSCLQPPGNQIIQLFFILRGFSKHCFDLFKGKDAIKQEKSNKFEHIPVSNVNDNLP